MKQVLSSSSALLFGVLLLMVGNGLQGSLLGVRAGIEGFSTFHISIIMSGYFAGFLGGSRTTPWMIRRVGHVRVFAALASFISAALILFPVVTHPVAWTVLRVVLGFCFSGVYVTAESWLNNASTNEVRGKALSAYMVVQMIGIVVAQAILSQGDPSGWVLFIIPSVLVSVSFAPILLSVTPTPPFETSKPMTLKRLFEVSPLGCVGMFFMGGVFAAQMGMAAVYGMQAGFSLGEISTFIAVIYIGAVMLQLPIGWISDRMDRRVVIFVVALIGSLMALVGAVFGNTFAVVLIAAFMTGGMANPLYSLLIAHTNDYLDPDDMAASSGGLIFINGVGAVGGPVVAGSLMGMTGPQGYWILNTHLMVVVACYAAYRTTRGAAVPVDETSHYVTVLPSTSPVASEVAQEVAIELAEADDSAASTETGSITPSV